MFEAETGVVPLYSRLGRVGSIQAWDPWKSRQSVAHAKWWVSKVASLSYGNDAAKNPEALFQSIVERGHLSCLEFVPMLDEDDRGFICASLPQQSLRSVPRRLLDEGFWGAGRYLAAELSEISSDPDYLATAFLVECPLYIRSQWMRHRSFSYLEMSRRYTKKAKIDWDYYGDVFRQEDGCPEQLRDPMDLRAIVNFWESCEREYQRRLDAGWPNEIARGCMPVEAMTKFWVAGFDRDWEAFLKLRDEGHAQPEIAVFAQWIHGFLGMKKGAI